MCHGEVSRVPDSVITSLEYMADVQDVPFRASARKSPLARSLGMVRAKGGGVRLD